MVERYVVVDQLKINHEGLFDFKEFYKVIGDWFFEKGYDRLEKLNEEVEGHSGKSLTIEMRPWKKLSDYIRNHIKVRIYVDHMVDVEVDVEGQKTKLNKGRIQLIIDGYQDKDWQTKWDKKPMHIFLRALFDKYIYKRYTEIHENAFLADINDLHSKIKLYLNQYNYMGKYIPQWLKKNE